MAFKDYFKKNRTVTVSGTPGFQRIYGKGQAGPVYSVDEIVKAILDGKITATELATEFEWTGSDTDRAKALLAVGNEVANERFKDSVKIEHKTDFGTVSKETAQVIQQFQQWAAQNGLENCPGITGAKITVGSESYEFDYPTQPQVQNPGAPVLPTAAPTLTPQSASSTDPAGWLFAQLPAGTWKIVGFDADAKPSRKVLFYEKKPGKLIVKSQDAAKKLIDEDEAEKIDFGWYSVQGWTPSKDGKKFTPVPDSASKEAF